jgi:hypothetical protein
MIAMVFMGTGQYTRLVYQHPNNADLGFIRAPQDSENAT